jgi:hypothetical protein
MSSADTKRNIVIAITSGLTALPDNENLVLVETSSCITTRPKRNDITCTGTALPLVRAL